MKISELIPNVEFESKKCEFKEMISHDFYEKWLKTINAFSNTTGGVLLFGVDDDGNFIGLNKENIDKEILYINHIIDIKLSPSINYEINRISNGKLLVLSINVKKNKKLPVWLNRKDETKVIYIRKDGESRLATSEEIENLVLSSKREDFDSKITKIKFGEVTFNDLNKVYKINNKVENNISLKLLQSKKVINEEGYLTNTGLLFMDNCDFENSNIHCRVWPNFTKGSDKVINDQTFKGNLLKLLDDATTFIKENTKQGYIKTPSGREKLISYPDRAITEALVNAFVHRDYYINGSQIDIDIFKDRLQITSPGSFLLPGEAQEYKMENIPSRRRNINICDVFQLCLLMEESGSGFSKILEEYEDASKDYQPSIYSDPAQFIITLKDLSYIRDNNDDETINKVLSFCVTPKTRQEIQDYLGIKTRTYISSKIIAPLLNSGKLKPLEKKQSPNQRYISTKNK